jgi:CHC2 zinc finger
MERQGDATASGSAVPETAVSNGRTGEFVRERLPDPIGYFESQGLTLKGPGKWKTARCEFHDGSDSMRVNTESGGWVCMACGERGGDVLAYAMRAHGLEFVEAARMLGAFIDGQKPQGGTWKTTTLTARDAMEVVAYELLVALVVVSDIRRGVIPSDLDWTRFLEAVGRVEALAAEYRT